VTAPVHYPPLLTALRALNPQVDPQRLDRIWFFPARRIGKQESAVAVLTLLESSSPSDRREVLTLVTSGVPGEDQARWTTELTDHGSVPADRVERLIDGVVRRLRDERETPHIESIAGDPERWTALLAGSAASG
jgi:hypothetical protein